LLAKILSLAKSYKAEKEYTFLELQINNGIDKIKQQLLQGFIKVKK